MALQWVAVDAQTGVLLADLVDVSFDGALKKTLGRYETVSAHLPVVGAVPENWARATLPGGANLIALDPDTNLPIWGGMVTQRSRTAADQVDLSLTTIEGYFDRRYVGTVSYASQSPNFIVADLVNRYILAGAKPGLPIRVQYSTGVVTMSQIYYDYNDITVYSALTSLMNLLNGPEWTVEWEWQHSPERITPVLVVGGSGGATRVGVSPSAGMSPNAQFTMPGPVRSFTLAEDYTTGKGANVVTANSSGQGLARPSSGPITVSDPSRPTFEYRYTPQQNLLVPLSLQQYARQAANVIGTGTMAVSFDADLLSAPKLGQDWKVGDDIGYQVGGIDQFGHDIIPAVPGGLVGSARSVGFQLTDEATPVITPLLYAPIIYTGS